MDGTLRSRTPPVPPIVANIPQVFSPSNVNPCQLTMPFPAALNLCAARVSCVLYALWRR